MCPTQVTLDHIKEIKNNGSVDLPTAIKMGTELKPATMTFTPGSGVEEIHTKLPISSRKFEASKELNEAKQDGDQLTCTYKYDKTFGRTGEFQLHTQMP